MNNDSPQLKDNKVSQIESEMDQLNSSLDRLDSGVTQLEQRLSDVIVESSPEVASEKDAINTMVPLAGAIRQTRKYITSIANRVFDITDRIEI